MKNLMILLFSIAGYASTYHLDNVNTIRLGSDVYLTWTNYTATSTDESLSHYSVRVSFDNFGNYTEYIMPLRDMNTEQYYFESYNLGNIDRASVQLFVHTIVGDNLVTTSNIVRTSVEQEYVYYLPHIANNSDYTTKLLLYSEITSHLEFYSYIENSIKQIPFIELDGTLYRSTNELFQRTLNRVPAYIRSNNPISITVVYVPTDGHISVANTVIPSNRVVVSGLIVDSFQSSALSITNTEDTSASVNVQVNEQVETITIEPFTTSIYPLPIGNYIARVIITSDNKLTALGVNFDTTSIEFIDSE